MSKTIAAVLAVLAVLGIAYYMNAQQGEEVQLQDGTYTGESVPDDRDQYGRVEMEIRDGKISAVTYDEFDSDGNVKGEDYPYPEAIEAQSTYEQRLIETQNVEEVDKVTGATSTWNKFKEAVNSALEKAQQSQ